MTGLSRHCVVMMWKVDEYCYWIDVKMKFDVVILHPDSTEVNVVQRTGEDMKVVGRYQMISIMM